MRNIPSVPAELDPGAGQQADRRPGGRARCAAPSEGVPALQAGIAGTKHIARAQLQSTAGSASQPAAAFRPQEVLLEGT